MVPDIPAPFDEPGLSLFALVIVALVLGALVVACLWSSRASGRGGRRDLMEPEIPAAITMTVDEHRARHVALHRALDELFADYIAHHPRQSSFLGMSVEQLITWSHAQTQRPTDAREVDGAGT